MNIDGDTVSIRPRWTKESNEDAERYIMSNAYVINMAGSCMRNMEKDFIITQYTMTKNKGLKDINAKPPKYKIA